ncbi:MAG: hypothetical protein BMS9Abin01_1616 [Gammaproteobacteria bacterium]|nr:MAG: hypothetical protein BMS9Abin01_1616 [Gammaproteobacteria bacterium]
MDAELYSRIFFALAIALVAGLAFMAVAHAWLAVGAKLQRRNPFAGQILLEPGHRVRQNLQNLDRSYYVYLSTLLVYGLLFVVAFALQSGPLPFDASAWVWLALSVLVAAASLLLPYRIVKLKRARSRLAFRRTANIAVGHALQRIASRGYNVYHDVRVGNHVIDNVVVGAKGAYAVNVFVLDNGRARGGTARLDDSSLVFGKAKTSAPVGVSVNRASGLSKELSKVIGHPIRVRSVIALPGWKVASTDSDKHLLVNEKTVVMLTGWTDPDTYLMDDDVAQIDDYLAARCVNGKQTPN